MAAELVTGVDFVGVPTRDLDSAVEFYGQTLGLRGSVYLKERNYAEFETGNLTLSLFSPDPDGNAWMLHHRYAPRVTESS